MSKVGKTKAKITLERDMIFKCDMGDIKLKDCYIDDTNVDEVDMLGPNPTRLLANAILGCLSASFIFCLKKRNFTLDDLTAEAEVTIGRKEKGFLRITKIEVNITPKIDDPEIRKRADQCKKMFENYCTVTASVREGINVEVNLDY